MRFGEDIAMANQTLISLKAIAEERGIEVERVLDGIKGVSQSWTSRLRPVVRKDDPPEED